MTNTLNLLKERYSQYYTASGAYRKHLMKQVGTNAAVVYDHFSKLEVRLDQLLRCKELTAASAPVVSEMLLKAASFREDSKALRAELLALHCGDTLGKSFGEAYDVAASIMEGFDAIAEQSLAAVTGPLSDDAQLIRRRTHLQKRGGSDKIRSLAAKQAWRANRTKYVRAIRQFHKSTTGKQFHRNLTRYNAMHTEGYQFTEDDTLVTAKGLSSMLTHLIIEIENTVTDTMHVEGSVEYIENLVELLGIFNNAMLALVDARLSGNKEAVADVLEVVCDFYSLGGEA